MFQDDIFPPCAAPTPALMADEWWAGTDKNPRLLAFTPDGLEETESKAVVSEREGGRGVGRERAPQSFMRDISVGGDDQLRYL